MESVAVKPSGIFFSDRSSTIIYVLSPIVICIWSGFSEGSTASSSLCGSSGVPKDVSVKSPRPLVFEEGFLLLPDEPPEVEEDPPEVEDEPPPDDAGSLTVTVALAPL